MGSACTFPQNNGLERHFQKLPSRLATFAEEYLTTKEVLVGNFGMLKVKYQHRTSLPRGWVQWTKFYYAGKTLPWGMPMVGLKDTPIIGRKLAKPLFETSLSNR